MPYTIEAPTADPPAPAAPAAGGKYTIEPPPTPPSTIESVMHGIAKPFVGMAQTASHLGIVAPPEEIGGEPTHPPATTAEIEAQTKKFEGDYQAKRAGQKGTDWPELGGEVVGQALNPFNYLLPGVGAASALGRVTLSALSAAGSSLFNPVASDDSFWATKAKQAAGSAAVGGAVGGVAQPIASAVAPHLRQAADLLAKAGVQMTPGQLSGGLGRFLEDRVLRNFPILGYFVYGAQGRSVEDFNKALAHQVLEPIGKTIGNDIGVGNELVEHVAKQVSDAYGQVLPMMSLKPDADFQNRMLAVAQQAQMLSPAAREQFRHTVEGLFAPHLTKADMPGEEINKITSELGQMAARYRKSALASEQDLGRLFGAAKGAIEDSLERQNRPELVRALQNIRASYAMLVRMEEAAGRRVASGGVFTPADLLAAVKKQDTSTRKRDFAHGDALLQPFAEAAQEVLPSKLPESGTVQAASHVAGVTGLLHGGMPAEAVAAGAALSPAYTKPGIAALNWLFGPSRPASQGARRIVEHAYPYGAGIGSTPAAEAMGLE